MLCTPAVSVLVVQPAVRLLPLPLKATAEQAAIDVAPSLKLTDPVGLVPVTVAVKVTLAPTVDGFGALASVVVVAAPPGTVTWTVSTVALAEIALMVIPLLLSV